MYARDVHYTIITETRKKTFGTFFAFGLIQKLCLSFLTTLRQVFFLSDEPLFDLLWKKKNLRQNLRNMFSPKNGCDSKSDVLSCPWYYDSKRFILKKVRHGLAIFNRTIVYLAIEKLKVIRHMVGSILIWKTFISLWNLSAESFYMRPWFACVLQISFIRSLVEEDVIKYIHYRTFTQSMTVLKRCRTDHSCHYLHKTTLCYNIENYGGCLNLIRQSKITN